MCARFCADVGASILASLVEFATLQARQREGEEKGESVGKESKMGE